MLLWPTLLAAHLGDASLDHASRASPAWRRQLLPVLRRRRYQRIRSRMKVLLRHRHLPAPQHDVDHQLRRCAVARCPYTQAFVLDLASSPPYLQTRIGRYCWQHRPERWPS